MEIEHIRQLSNKAINYLISKNSSQGHWEDIRSTALTVFAFEEVFTNDVISAESKQTLVDILKYSKSWLIGQARKENRGISWNAEVWDTAFAILALTKDEQYSDKVDLAIAWLKNQKSNISNSWYEELWETILALIAIIRYEQSIQPRSFKDVDWIDNTIAWICHFPSDDNGMFLTPHYSGFLVWLTVELKEAKLTSLKSFDLLAEKTSKAVDWIVDVTKNSDTLWSEYIYANSYILHAITRLERMMKKTFGMNIRLIEDWYTRNQSPNGCFEDFEDTALAILSLSSLVEASEFKERPIYNISTIKNVPQITNCFMGYAGKSSMLASMIKDNIRRDFPNISLMDWEWDFHLGNQLFTEIDTMSKTSQIGIFLITKDDVIVTDESEEQFIPRDNVIFEVGFFAARLDFFHTIMIIEKGTKIPSDLAGILNISFDKTSDISKVILPLSRHLRKITNNESK